MKVNKKTNIMKNNHNNKKANKIKHEHDKNYFLKNNKHEI